MKKRFIFSTALLLLGSVMGAIAQGDGSSSIVDDTILRSFFL